MYLFCGMPLLAVGKLCLEHVFCMLDAIKACSQPLQVARKDGKIWSFLYVSYESEACMRVALGMLQDFVKKTWGIYGKGPPFVCAGEDVQEMIFQVFVKDTPIGMHSNHIVAHFERDTDLLAWNAVEVVCNLGGFFVNFVDFEDAMKHVRRSEKRQLFVQGKHMYVRPQRNVVVALKLFAHMQQTGQTSVNLQDVQRVCSRFSMYVDHAKMDVIMQCLYTVFEKVEGNNPPTANVYRLRPSKEHLLQTYSMHRVQRLEDKLEALRDTLCALCMQILCRISEREGVNTGMTAESASAAMRTLLCECRVLFENDSPTWKYPQVIVCLCTESVRAELRKIHNMPAEKTAALWADSPEILPQVLADEHLISYKKIRCTGYRDMLKNAQGNLVCAMKALHVCLDIVTWNAYVSAASFECLSNIIKHSHDVMAAVVQDNAGLIQTCLPAVGVDAIAVDNEFDKHERQ